MFPLGQYIPRLQITETVHLILECPVVSYSERVNNAISSLNDVVKTDELVSIHLTVSGEIHVKPLPSNPLENSMNYFHCVELFVSPPENASTAKNLLANSLKWKAKSFEKKFLGVLVCNRFVVTEVQFHDISHSMSF